MRFTERNTQLIIRTDKSKNYTVMANYALNDDRLSLKACGLWAWLMSKPDNWQISINGIYAQRKEGRDAIRSAITELEDSGYLIRAPQVRKEDGTYGSAESVLHESSVLENTTSGNTTSENPIQVNTDKVNTDKVIVTNVTTVPESEILKPIKKIYGNPDVNEIIETFEKEMDMKLTEVTKQRKFAKLLLNRGDLIVIKQGILAAAACQADQYAPQITSIEKLYYKWNDLLAYYRKRQKKQAEPNVDLGDL